MKQHELLKTTRHGLRSLQISPSRSKWACSSLMREEWRRVLRVLDEKGGNERGHETHESTPTRTDLFPLPMATSVSKPLIMM
jgi:hypothetical protein